jgi:hypothetical protein
MKATRKEFVDMYKKLDGINETLHKKVLFCLFKNKSLCKDVLDSIVEKETSIVTNEYIEYEKQRRVLLLTYCERDEKGPIIKNNEFIIKAESIEEFNKQFNELSEKYKETLTDYNTKNNELNSYINGVIEIDFVKFSFSELPDYLTVDNYKTLSLFIKEDVEDITKMV